MFELILNPDKVDYIVRLVKEGTAPNAIRTCPADSFYHGLHYTAWIKKYPNYNVVSRFSGFNI